MDGLLVCIFLYAASVQAGLECRTSEIQKALASIALNRKSNCSDAELMRIASRALRELASEPACDQSLMIKAQKALAEARVAPLLNDQKSTCVALLDAIEAHLKQLTTSVKTDPRPSAVGQ